MSNTGPSIPTLVLAGYMEALAFAIAEAGQPQVDGPEKFLARVRHWLENQVATQGTSSPVQLQGMRRLHDLLEAEVRRLA